MHVCLIHNRYIFEYLCIQRVDVKGLIEHRNALSKFRDLLFVSMTESKDVSVIISGIFATISRKLVITTTRPILETRDWKIVDGHWKLLSVRIEDI